MLRKEPDNRWDPEIAESLPGLHCCRKGFVFLVNRHRTNLTKLMPEWISIIPEILAKKQVFCDRFIDFLCWVNKYSVNHSAGKSRLVLKQPMDAILR